MPTLESVYVSHSDSESSSREGTRPALLCYTWKQTIRVLMDCLPFTQSH